MVPLKQLADREVKGVCKRTVVIPKDEPVQAVEAEEVEEVPREGGHPADVHVRCLDSALEHALESKCEREGKLD